MFTFSNYLHIELKYLKMTEEVKTCRKMLESDNNLGPPSSLYFSLHKTKNFVNHEYNMAPLKVGFNERSCVNSESGCAQSPIQI